MKTCTYCGEVKPLERFSRAGIGSDKVQRYKARCKDCTNAMMRDDRKAVSRNHFENVVREKCPHGGGIRRFVGWGYAP